MVNYSEEIGASGRFQARRRLKTGIYSTLSLLRFFKSCERKNHFNQVADGGVSLMWFISSLELNKNKQLQIQI